MKTAFEVSKQIFNELYVGRDHLTVSRLKPTHSGGNPPTTGNELRLAEDTIFLSILTKEAKSRGDAIYSQALAHLNKAIGYLHSKLSVNTMLIRQPYQSPGTSLILQATVLIKKYNMADLSSTRQGQVNEMYRDTKNALVNGYSVVYNTKFGSAKTIVENQKLSPAGRNRRSPIGMNIVGLAGAALALDSYLLVSTGNPNGYPHRQMIANIGNYMKFINFGDDTRGRLTGVSDERDWVDTGYITYHSVGLALMALGTVHPSDISIVPSSVFSREAVAIGKGLQTVYSNQNNMPMKWDNFASTQSEVKDSTLSSGILYSLMMTGDQNLVNWVDRVNKEKYPSLVVAGEPIVVSVARADETGGDGFEPNFHRITYGLSFGMLRNLYFN